MTDQPNADQLREQLADIDTQLVELRRLGEDAEARRSSDGAQSQGIVEPEELATDLTGIAENEAVIDVLTQRRETIEEKLRALG